MSTGSHDNVYHMLALYVYTGVLNLPLGGQSVATTLDR